MLRVRAFDPDRHSQYPRQNRWTTNMNVASIYNWHLSNHPIPSWGPGPG